MQQIFCFRCVVGGPGIYDVSHLETTGVLVWRDPLLHPYWRTLLPGCVGSTSGPSTTHSWGSEWFPDRPTRLSPLLSAGMSGCVIVVWLCIYLTQHVKVNSLIKAFKKQTCNEVHHCARTEIQEILTKVARILAQSDKCQIEIFTQKYFDFSILIIPCFIDLVCVSCVSSAVFRFSPEKLVVQGQ